jgi:hypothetical protein
VELDRRHLLLCCVLATAALLLWRTAPPRIGGRVEVQILKQHGGVDNLDAPKKSEQLRTIVVDRLVFDSAQSLRHAQFGDLGFNRDFFLIAKTTMTVSTPAEFEFSVTSDDGYRLTLDGRTLGEHPQMRAAQTDHLTATLNPGIHRLELQYFQAYGPLALSAYYRRPPDGQQYAVGEDSLGVSFSAGMPKAAVP